MGTTSTNCQVLSCPETRMGYAIYCEEHLRVFEQMQQSMEQEPHRTILVYGNFATPEGFNSFIVQQPAKCAWVPLRSAMLKEIRQWWPKYKKGLYWNVSGEEAWHIGAKRLWDCNKHRRYVWDSKTKQLQLFVENKEQS